MKKQSLFTTSLLAIELLLSGCNMKVIPNAIDIEEYLATNKSPSNIYQEKSNGLFYNPFNFNHTNFGKLILASIEGHPVIKAIELVVQNDNKGAFVVVYYHNGKVENYINSFLTIDRKYLKPNTNWEIAGEQDFEFLYKDTPTGINFALDITIKNGQRIKISLQENRVNIKRYSFLAAIGADLTEVKRFPFIFLRDAGFLPVEMTDVHFEIDGKQMKLKRIPIKVEGEKCYKTVYSLTPLPFFWNEERNICLSPENISNTLTYQIDDTEYLFVDNNGHKEIKTIKYKADGHLEKMWFSPSFPEIASLKIGEKVNGKFSLGVDDIEGVIGGTYSVIKINDEITIDFQPEKCWQPMPGRDWVSAYHYHAKLKLIENKELQIQSGWIVK
jgi:hypothetical protein